MRRADGLGGFFAVVLDQAKVRMMAVTFECRLLIEGIRHTTIGSTAATYFNI
jgi:hypothetical protein